MIRLQEQIGSLPKPASSRRSRQVGQVVRRGELIVQLNNTMTEASLGESVAQARALGAKIARLALEETGSYDVEFVCPQEVQAVAVQVCENEERLFAANKAAYLNKAGRSARAGAPARERTE